MKIAKRFIFFSITLIFCSATLKAQDTLFLKSGVKIASKIIEISPSEVKYKKSDNPDGPTFISNSSDVSIIKYKNGSVDTLKAPKVSNVETKQEPIYIQSQLDKHPSIYPYGPFYKAAGRHMKERDMHEVISEVKDPVIDGYVAKAKKAKLIGNIGFVAIPAFVGGLIYLGVAALNNNGDYNSTVRPPQMAYWPGTLCEIIAAGCLTTSITFKYIRKNSNKAAIKIYNEKY